MPAEREATTPHEQPRHDLLVGREAELSALESRLDQARAGSGSVVLLAGQSGIGKTALVRALLARADEDRSLSVLRGACVEHYGPGEAYGPFLGALGAVLASRGRAQALAILEAHAPTWCLQVAASALSAEAREQLLRRTIGASKERMLRELVEGVQAATAENPLLLVVEDMHWADPSSVDALRLLARQVARHRLLVLATYRPEMLSSRHPMESCRADLASRPRCTLQSLGPLPAAHLQEWITLRYGPVDPSGALVRLVVERTEGNPLFVVTFLSALEGEGFLRRGESGWEVGRDLRLAGLDVPESLRSMVRRRVDLLPEADRLALQYASVIGREFDAALLAPLVREDEVRLEERLVGLGRTHGLLELLGEEEQPGGALTTRFRFAHGLVRTVLYEDLVSGRRAALHKQVAAELAERHGPEATRLAGALALHLERGRDFAGAVRQHSQAGDNAAVVYAYGEALGHYAQAAALLDRLPSAQRPAWGARLQQRRGVAQHALGRFDEAIAEFDRMLKEARQAGAAALELEALSGLCHSLFFARRLEEMAVRAHEVLGLAARSGQQTRQVEATVHVLQILLAEGRVGEATPLLDGAVSAARRIGHGPALSWALFLHGFARYWRGEYEAAAGEFAEVHALGSRQRDGSVVLVSLMFLGLCRVYLGRIDEALALFEEGAQMGRGNGDRFWLPRIVGHLGWIHRELQSFERARAYDEEALALARERPVDWAPQAEPLLNLTIDDLRSGREREARGFLQELEALAAEGGWFAWMNQVRLDTVLAEEGLLHDDLAAAEAHASRLLARARESGADAYAVSAHVLLGAVAERRGDLEAARTHLELAATQLLVSRSAIDQWKVQAALGRVLARSGAVREAEDACRQAVAVVDEIASHVSDAGLRACFLGSPAVAAVRCGVAAGA